MPKVTGFGQTRHGRPFAILDGNTGLEEWSVVFFTEGELQAHDQRIKDHYRKIIMELIIHFVDNEGTDYLSNMMESWYFTDLFDDQKQELWELRELSQKLDKERFEKLAEKRKKARDAARTQTG